MASGTGALSPRSAARSLTVSEGAAPPAATAAVTSQTCSATFRRTEPLMRETERFRIRRARLVFVRRSGFLFGEDHARSSFFARGADGAGVVLRRGAGQPAVSV